MTDMQQIPAGMNEVNERVQTAEARATEVIQKVRKKASERADGAEGGRAGGACSVSTSPPTM